MKSQIPNFEIVNQLKQEYPPGTKVMLERMSDPYADMPSGTKGIVTSVDDIGTIHVDWENNHHLGILYGIDLCRKIC